MTVPLGVEVVFVVVSFAINLSFLVMSIAGRSSRWMFSSNAGLRKRWTESLLANDGNALLGVQTYRNVIMSSSFLATAVLGMAAVFLSSITSIEALDTINRLGSHDPLASINPETGEPYITSTVKLMILFGVCFLSFFFMTQSIRLHMHLGFSMKADAGTSNEDVRMHTLSTALIAMSYFAFGLRTFYLVFPAVVWLVGTMWLFIASIFTTAALFVFDTNHEWGHRMVNDRGFNDV